MPEQEQWTPEQYRLYHAKEQGNKNKGNRLKYNNVRKTVDGFNFDSTKEAEHYGKLKLMQRAGLVTKIEVHVVYQLAVNGEHITSYEADFVVTYPDGKVEVQDVKSVATEHLPIFEIKKALMKAIHGIIIKIVK